MPPVPRRKPVPLPPTLQAHPEPRYGQLYGGLFETPTGRPQGPSPYGYKPPQDSMNALQALSLGTMTIPGVSDALGLAGDLQMYYQQPESRGMLNYALTGAGMLPFVPSVAGITLKHGSPSLYKNITKENPWGSFDLSFLKSGEGTAFQGEGFYKSKSTDLAEMQADIQGMGRGYVYDVDVPDDLYAQYMKLDYPMAKQHEKVRQSIEKLTDSPQMRQMMMTWDPEEVVRLTEGKMTGKELFANLEEAFGSPEAAGRILDQAGIPGLRYLDLQGFIPGPGGRPIENAVTYPSAVHRTKIVNRTPINPEVVAFPPTLKGKK